MIEAGGTTMGKAFATLLVALMLMIGGGGIVHAGPLEDGVGAYKRGDYTTALRILRPLANQGNAEAQFWLGAMYEHGRGVAHDYREARHWVRLAAEQGNALAQTFLGIAYGEGRGVIQDFQEALKWTRLAAEQGQAAAQLYLGFMYEEGIGVAQDYQRAYMWSDIAASKHGDDAILRAINQRDRIAKHLTAAQRLLAQQMARQCEASGFKNCE
jgi:TPR repeat protein